MDSKRKNPKITRKRPQKAQHLVAALNRHIRIHMYALANARNTRIMKQTQVAQPQQHHYHL